MKFKHLTTIKQAIINVLKLENKPLSSKNIYNKIIELDFYRFKSENPEHIVLTALRRHCVGLDFPTANRKKIFQLFKDGTYWIKDVPVIGISQTAMKSEMVSKKDAENIKLIVSELKDIHSKHTIAFKKQILNQLKEIDPKTFESFGEKLLEVYGFKEVKVTKYVKDGGIDGYGELKVGITHLNVAFQCKRWKSTTVGRTEIDKFRGAIQGSYEQGIIFTTSAFSKEALNATRRNGAVPIILIDGNTLIEIMIDKGFGVASESIPVYINALDRALTEEI